MPKKYKKGTDWSKLWSSKDEKWRTPKYVFDHFNKEYKFNFDAAASPQNAKCKNFLSQSDNALESNWCRKGRRIWLNPPYSRQMGVWIEKAYKESQKGCLVACLVFARTDTAWWHDYVMKKAWKVHFIRGRIRFLSSKDGKTKSAAPAPSCLIVFKPNKKKSPTVVSDTIVKK